MRFVGDLDPKVSWVIDRVLRPEDTALDIGANLGLVSLRMCARVGPKGQVHAFEPQPRLVTLLNETLARNPNLPLTLHPIALGPENTELEMSVPAHNAGGASLVSSVARPGDRRFSVPVRRLTDYVGTLGLIRIDVIKMDVEGFEAHVLEGGIEILQKTRPHTILLEENALDPKTHASPALDILKTLDYKIYALPKRLLSVRLVPIEEAQGAHDCVALHQDAPDWVRAALRL